MGDDLLVQQSLIREQALLVARLVAEDEQEQILSAARAGVDRRRDALGRTERQAVHLFEAAFVGEQLVEVVQGV